MNETVEVFSPIGAEVVTKGKSAPRLETLDGKTVGETWNDDFKGDFMFPVYRELLRTDRSSSSSASSMPGS